MKIALPKWGGARTFLGVVGNHWFPSFFSTVVLGQRKISARRWS